MTIVLTNDDGIEAPGLEALYRILSAMGPTVVVAPATARSGAAHQVTVRRPIAVRQLDANRYQVDGTPADCARIALKEIVPDAAWVVAGINPGANLGSDVYNSGTVAAAREAAILGCHSMAVSQYIARGETVDWGITTRHAAPVVAMLMEKGIARGCFWNVNLPHPLAHSSRPEHVFCDIDTNPHAYTYRREEEGYVYVGTIHERPRDPGRDVAVCFGGAVSISRLGLGEGCR